MGTARDRREALAGFGSEAGRPLAGRFLESATTGVGANFGSGGGPALKVK